MRHGQAATRVGDAPRADLPVTSSLTGPLSGASVNQERFQASAARCEWLMTHLRLAVGAAAVAESA